MVIKRQHDGCLFGDVTARFHIAVTVLFIYLYHKYIRYR